MRVVLQLTDVSGFPCVRELVRLNPGEGDQYVALAHWILSSKSFAVKTLQKEEVGDDPDVFQLILCVHLFTGPFLSTSTPGCVT